MLGKELSTSHIKQLIELNSEEFGEDDDYNSPKIVKPEQVIPLIIGNELVAYAIVGEDHRYVECVRRAVSKDYRGLGLGVTLTKLMIRAAKGKGKSYITYCHKNNLASLNSNIKCGLRVYKVDGPWVHLKSSG